MPKLCAGLCGGLNLISQSFYFNTRRQQQELILVLQ